MHWTNEDVNVAIRVLISIPLSYSRREERISRDEEKCECKVGVRENFLDFVRIYVVIFPEMWPL